MTAAQRQAAREEINNRPLTDFFALQESKHGAKNAAYHQYICPVCGSGTGKSGTGAFTLYAESKRCRCYACDAFGDKGQDTLGALKIIWSCSENEVFERLHIDINSKGVSKPVKRPEISEGNYTTNATGTAQNALQSVTERKQAATVTPIDFDKANSLLQAENNPGRKYLEQRGLNLETLNRFKIGVKYFYDNVNIIIPTNDVAYRERPIAASKESGKSRYYWKYAQKDRKQWDIFNETALDYNGYIFIVEGEIDAMSIEQSGFAAAAYCGTPNTERLIAAVKSRKHEPGRKFIIIQDIDESGAGQRAAAKIKEGLQGVGYSAYITSIPEYHDSNDFLKADSKGLKTWLSYQITEALKEEITIMNDTSNIEAATKPTEPQNGATGEIIPPTTDTAQRAAQTANTAKYEIFDIADYVYNSYWTDNYDKDRTPTGFKELDKNLSGGLKTGLYMLGAMPGAGKTSFLLQMADNLADSGENVLFFSLEQSGRELALKSISRYSKRFGNGANLQYTRERNEFRRAEIDGAINAIKNRPGRVDFITAVSDIDAIESAIAEYTAATGKKPIVMIDYLQLIRCSAFSDLRVQTNYIIGKLVEMKVKHDLTVWLISNLNREAMRNGFTITAFRETSDIEYNAECMIGLEVSEDQAKEVVREIKLKCVKQKNGKGNFEMKLSFNAAFSMFEEPQPITSQQNYFNPYGKR
jgi:replicative DNA helicase|nr:MAG TPA: Helicase, ATPase, REPLICATION [Caudoviricetes sp.]